MLKKSDANNNRGNWNHLKITTIPEQHTGKAQNQKTTEKSHTGHCTNTSQSTNVKYVQNVQMENSITRAMNCEYRTAITYILGT
jgi:formate dehydrogenase assembly factor FdhD